MTLIRLVQSFTLAVAAVIAAAALLSPYGAAAQQVPSKDIVVVKDLRAGVNGTRTRFVMDLSGPVNYSYFGLVDPYRLVIDLPELGWQLPRRPLPKNVGLIKSLRYGLFKAGASRVVLDVGGPMIVKAAFLMPPEGKRGHRLVLDLEAADRAAFMAGLVEPRRAQIRAAAGPRAAVPGPGPSPGSSADQTARAAPGLPVPRRKPNRFHGQRVIAIDPGHGGVDPGTIGRSGVLEKDITLRTARVLKRRLERSGRYKVVLTRDRDVFIRLRDRIDFARRNHADLFISLHADSIRRAAVRGLSVYTLSEKASDKEAAELAEKENKADLIAGIDLSAETPEVTDILIDLAQRETMNESARFAAELVQELRRVTRLLRKTHRFAGFAVLKAPDVPSVLIEMGFLSNRQDERALRQDSYRARIADAVAEAIDRYFERIEQAER